MLSEQEKLGQGFGSAKKALSHPEAKGSGAEDAWITVIRDFLPKRYAVGKAFIVDADGNASGQIDIVIHDRQYCPLFFEYGGHLYLPAESVYGVFEVKPELNKSNIDYAAEKIESVRALRRTSAPIPHAGGEFDSRDPFPILGGILAATSGWEDPLGETFEKAITDAPAELQLGCTPTEGSFVVSWQHGTPAFTKSEPEGSLMFFLTELFSKLRAVATVPAIDLEEYAKHLTQPS